MGGDDERRGTSRSSRPRRRATPRSPTSPSATSTPRAIARKLGGDRCALVHPGAGHAGRARRWAESRLARSRLSMLRGTASIAGPVRSGAARHHRAGGRRRPVQRQGLRVGGDAHRRPRGLADRAAVRIAAGAVRAPARHRRPAGGRPAAAGRRAARSASSATSSRIRSASTASRSCSSVLDKKQGAVWARVASPDAGKESWLRVLARAGRRGRRRFRQRRPAPGDRPRARCTARRTRRPTPPGPPNKDNNQRAIVSKNGIVISLDDKKKAVTHRDSGQEPDRHRRRREVDHARGSAQQQDHARQQRDHDEERQGLQYRRPRQGCHQRHVSRRQVKVIP